MEIKAELINPTKQERCDFIIQQNYKLGYSIEEYDSSEIIENEEIITHHIEAWGLTEQEEEEKEKERIANLTCTKRVLILMLEELGFDYFKQIQPLIEANRQAKLEWELCSELQRKNPLLDSIGAELKITPEQLDRLFQYANGEVESLV